MHEASTPSTPSTRTAARTWSNAGSVYTTDRRDRTQFNVEVALLSWVAMGPEARCPDMTVLAVIAAYELQGVTGVASGGGLDYPDGGGVVRHGLLGVECASAEGRCRFYVLDTGTHLIPLAWDFWAAGATP